MWEELIPGDQLETTDPFARKQELELRKRIYCWENFRDDRVVDNVIICPIAIEDDLKANAFGLRWPCNWRKRSPEVTLHP